MVYTVLLARLHWAAPLEEELKSRPKLAEYWGVVKERPSFKEADVVDSVRLSFVASQLVEVVKDVAEEAAKATIRTSNSVGEFWNDKARRRRSLTRRRRAWAAARGRQGG